jgi:flavin reductase (DIM6/NTAB) family NADH-FMN oxidoreductase RutF
VDAHRLVDVTAAPRSGSVAATAETLRATLRHHPAGVVVVTAGGPDGPAGCAVSSFTSASLHPPLISLLLHQSSSTCRAVTGTGRLAVHLLGARDQELAARFAERRPGRFLPPVRWCLDEEDVPWIQNGAARLRCTVERTVGVGDHVLFIAEVHAIDAGRAADPLVYLNGRYGVHSPL